MKQKKILLGYFFLGLVIYLSYIIVYNSKFDLGLFCDSSTECFSLTKTIIFFNWSFALFLILVFNFIAKNRYLNANILFVGLIFNIIKLGSGSSVPFLFVSNFFLLLIPFQILGNERFKSLLILNITLLLCIYLFELSNISELFYYNQNYSSIENVFYILISLMFAFNIIFSITKYNKSIKL